MTDTNKKYFLDLEGLKTLWDKISSTFTDIETFNVNKAEIEVEFAKLIAKVNGIESDIYEDGGINETLMSIIPKECETYEDAEETAKQLSIGTIINVKNNTYDSDEDNASIIRYSGLYIVTGDGTISKLPLSTGEYNNSIDDIASDLQELNDSVIKSAAILDENNTVISEVNVTDNTLLFKIDDTFVVNSDSVNALTHKAISVMFDDLIDKINEVPRFNIEIVDELPNIYNNSDLSLSTIYLLRNTEDAETSPYNLYEEYICIEDRIDPDNKYRWEKLGANTLATGGLDDENLNTVIQFVTEYINSKLANFVTQKNLSDTVESSEAKIYKKLSDEYLSKEEADATYVKIGDNTGGDNSYITKEDADATYLSITDANNIFLKKNDLDSVLTEDLVIESILTGNIGNAIRITDDQINSIVNPTTN